MTNVIYIGNLYTIAEYIFFNKEFRLVGILCEEDRVNDKLLTFSLVREVPIYRVSSSKKIEDYINMQPKDTIFLMCSYGRRVPVEKCSGHLIFNIHYAALPNYKGRHPSYWATVNNEKHLGVTIHVVTEEFDQGDIIAQRMVPYYLWEDESIIFEKLTNEVPTLLDNLVDYIQKNENIEVKRNSKGGYYKPVSEDDISLDLKVDSPALIFNKIRSQTRAGGAYVSIKKKRFRLFDAVFTERRMDCDYEIDGLLYIRYSDEISIVCSKFEEVE